MGITLSSYEAFTTRRQADHDNNDLRDFALVSS